MRLSRGTSRALAAVFALTLVLLALAPLGAVQCYPPDQKTTYGCCSCNVVKAIYWHCSESGTWVQSGSACLWGTCCDRSKPCCA
jgi:hypothetical protein